MTARWHAALGYALTGTEPALPDAAEPEPAALAAALAEAGWPADRIAAHALATLTGGGVWPHPIPAALRVGCGAAQLAAALGATRQLLGLTTFETRPPSAPRRLDRDEERLMREVPPHHGS